MAAEPILDEDYASADDSDFAPDDAPERNSSPDSDDEADSAADRLPAGTAPGRKRQAGDNEAEDAGFENSGDEAIIEKGAKRRKKAKHAEADVDNEEGGEGGFIKTRSQRAQEKAERKTAAVSGPVTIDVDAVWAQMMAEPATSKPAERTETEATATVDDANTTDPSHAPMDLSAPPESNMIKIKRTYNFAGKVHTEEKLVSRDSAEAKLYLASLGDDAEAAAAAAAAAAEDAEPKRMPRRAFRSAFEPIIDQSPQRTDLNLGMTVRLKAREAKENARKLNTVEKSRMDWVGFVDKEGIQDELDLAGKSKGSFAQRQQFLARAEARREEEARRARIAGKA